MLKVANSVISASRITGTLPVANGGTGVTTSTGTGNTVLSASPTLSGDVSLSTGNLVIGTAGKGIDFTVTSSGSGTMTSELLADYEEGTFTATMDPLTSGSITLDATRRVGGYTKVGRQVTLTGFFIVDSVSLPVGRLRISGLPFTSKAGTNFDTCVTLFIQSAVTSVAVMATVPNAGSFIDFYPFNTASDTYAAQIQAGTNMIISVTYFTA